MKPVAFDYARPTSLPQALAMLAGNTGAKVLAGGQTLGPMLNLRLAQPQLLVDITRIAVTNPAIADAVVVKPREVLVDGKSSGTVSLIVWGGDTRKHYDVVVDSGVSMLQQNFQQLFPGERINVAITDEAVILSGEVSSNDVMLRGVTLRSELASGPLTTRGDRVQLRQVLLNLVINALEALSEVEGERRVVIRTERLTGGLARISVEDTGPGLRPPDASDVFMPFYTTKEKGMGMGLSIARSILESHGGAITAWNNPRAGASFAFTLPLQPVQA